MSKKFKIPKLFFLKRDSSFDAYYKTSKILIFKEESTLDTPSEGYGRDLSCFGFLTYYGSFRNQSEIMKTARSHHKRKGPTTKTVKNDFKNIQQLCGLCVPIIKSSLPFFGFIRYPIILGVQNMENS